MDIASNVNIKWLGDPKTVTKYNILIPSGVLICILFFIIMFYSIIRQPYQENLIEIVLLGIGFLILLPIVFIGIFGQGVLTIGISENELIVRRWFGKKVFPLEEIQHLKLKPWALTKSILIITRNQSKYEYPFSIEFKRTGDEGQLISWWNSHK